MGLRSSCIEEDAYLAFRLKTKQSWFIESRDPTQPIRSGRPSRDVCSSGSLKAVKARHNHLHLWR